MTFKQLDEHRYQVLDENGKLLGTAVKEVFTTYPDGVAQEGFFWLARSRGYVQVPGKFASRRAAAEALIESQEQVQ